MAEPTVSDRNQIPVQPSRRPPSTFRPSFLSLRARLIASHGFVILLALAFVLLLSGVYLRRYERSVEKDRIEQYSRSLTISANFLAKQSGNTLRIEAIDALAAEENIRLLVFNRRAEVLYDSEESGSLTGQILTDYLAPIRSLLQVTSRRNGIHQQWIEPAATDPLAGHLVLLSAGGPGAQGRALAIVAPPRRYPLLRRYLPILMVVAAISLAVASLAGYLLSRRISAPVDRLTRATHSMAAGHLEQDVPGEGPDELGRLVASFNTMSRRVAATSRSQRDLLADVAHELRTPLTSVQGYAQALRDGVIEDRSEQDRALATIGRESDRMASLIGQLLDLARLESGQTRLNLQPVLITPLFNRVAERFRPTATHRGITLLTNATPNLAVQGDDARLTQILSNLVDNALRHTPANGYVKLEAASTPAAIRLTVADTGEGISPDRLPHIFNRFDRASRDPTDRSGFGLGLAIVRELVTLHHGTIRVSSQPETGTTFVIDLPRAALTS